MIVREQFITVFDPRDGRIVLSRSLARYDDPEEIGAGYLYVLNDAAGLSGRMVKGDDGEWRAEPDADARVEHTYTRQSLNEAARHRIDHPDAYPVGKQRTIDRNAARGLPGAAERQAKMDAYIDAVLEVANTSEGKSVSDVVWPDIAEFKGGLLNAPQFNAYMPLKETING